MKKGILSIFVAATLLLNYNSLYAKNIDEKSNKGASGEGNVSSGVSVKFIGESKDNGVVFDVDFSNLKGQNFTLEISNNQDENIYRQSFSDVNFHKTIMIKKDSDTPGKVTFLLRSKGNDFYSKSFTIDTKTYVLRSVVANDTK